MKIITKEQYDRIFEGIENYINNKLDWRTDELLRKSFGEAYNGLLGKANSDISKRFKMSCLTRYLELTEYDKVIRRIIIFKYTRKDNLIIAFDDTNKVLFKKEMTLKEMERLGY